MRIQKRLGTFFCIESLGIGIVAATDSYLCAVGKANGSIRSRYNHSDRQAFAQQGVIDVNIE